MLRQILADMFIDPDLLAELSEEQKQILFYKMREEQIRRWKEREAAMERKESLPVKSRPKKENGKSVHWKLGADKKVWVWVMGEHHLDKPYDVLCDEILAERAHLRAAQDSELRKAQSVEFTNSLRTKSQSCGQQAPEKLEPQNVTRKAAAEETPGQGPRATATKSEDKAHVSHTCTPMCRIPQPGRGREMTTDTNGAVPWKLRHLQPLWSRQSPYIGGVEHFLPYAL